ncbi:hypothetical protein ZHAS_00004295 [Anopheles sinensis]|uniref:Uncharacterized protein n=1 Tax=Anopheles sinensis TaxID=74873 RepID=A0A084VGJ4_ANOSI|nr:hypothetical protein ZHAS_00004295 [Anopheles sinensis]
MEGSGTIPAGISNQAACEAASTEESSPEEKEQRLVSEASRTDQAFFAHTQKNNEPPSERSEKVDRAMYGTSPLLLRSPLPRVDIECPGVT